MNKRDHFKPSPIWWEVCCAYAFPAAMFAAAIIPGCNASYSGHGGVSWLVIPLCFPVVLVRALMRCFKGRPEAQAWYKRFYRWSMPAYLAIAWPLSWVSVTSIDHAFGLKVSSLDFYLTMVSPFPWWYFT